MLEGGKTLDEKDLKKYVGNRIREERKRMRLSQKELGEKIGVKHNTISQYENATNSPEQDSLFKIARALDIKVDDLFPPMNVDDKSEIFERTLKMAEGLELGEINFLKSLIEKTLSMEGEGREKFLESMKFTIEYYEKMNK